MDISATLVRELARAPHNLPEGVPVVFVAASDIHYGLARMFQILKESSKFQVVRTMEQAYVALGVQEAEFSPIEEPS